jgi:[ribosomal protein S18]-alanine N-acetyltransferase
MMLSDIKAVLDIERVSFGQHHWSHESFACEISNQMGRYYVFEPQIPEAPAIIGYIGCWVVLDEGHITTVATHPDWRGLALGELMVHHLLGWLMYRKVSWGTLEVRVSNFSAQNLYYKYGFESQGRRAKYYQDNNEDALIMTTPDMQTEAYRQFWKQHEAALLQRLKGAPLPKGFGVYP